MPEFEMTSHHTAPHSAPPPPFLYELRPLSTGEILDRTFSLYRRHFWLYAGLSSVAAAVTTLGTFAQLSFGFTGTKLQTADGPRALLLSSGFSLLSGVFYLLAYSVTQAATVSAVSAVYLGHQTSIGIALRTVKSHWFRYMVITLWQAWSAMWLPLVLLVPAFTLLIITRLNLVWLGGLLFFLFFASLVYGIIAFIRNSLGIVSSVMEDLRIRSAMQRSKQLVAGRKGRVFALLLLIYVLSLVAGVLQGVFAVFLLIPHSTPARIALESLTLLMTFLTTAVVTPVGAIAFYLFYVDERVRREGYDVEILMDRAAAAPAVASPPSTPPPFSSSELA